MEPAAGTPIESDVTVIGAGPAGLFAAFQLGLLGLSCQIVDALPRPGGQCVELYGDKLIYDIPGLPEISGQDLAHRLIEQIAPFGFPLHLGQTVTTLIPPVQAGDRFQLATSAGLDLRPRAVIVAAGVGAFEPRPLQADGVDALSSPELLFEADHAALADPSRSILIIGGGEEAAWAAQELVRRRPANSRPVSLLHRRPQLSVEPEVQRALYELETTGALCIRVGMLLSVHNQLGSGVSATIDLLDEAGNTQTFVFDHLLVCLGRSPRLGPIRDWGLDLVRKQLPVDSATLSTNHPRLFAIGDIASYPGKKKLIVCAFHEATLCAYAVKTSLDPASQEPPLLYTSSSTELQKRLKRQAEQKYSESS